MAAVLDKFFTLELREAKVQEFINLKQCDITVKDYCLKFIHLSKYVAESRARMSKFVLGVPYTMVKECRTAMLIKKMGISRLMTMLNRMRKKRSRRGIWRVRGLE